MLRFLNNIIANNPIRKTLRSSTGQVAIVLILIIAAVLVFYAVSLNWGQLAQIKARVSITSNTSAGLLASNMASYAQALSETNLKGKKKLCDSTGLLLAVIKLVVVIIIAIIVSVISLGTLAAPAVAIAVAIAVTAASANVALQAAVVNPGITKAWNKMQSKTLSRSNSFTEAAIQSALGKIATDGVAVPDILDADGDRVWVGDVSATPPFEDTISRFSAYYSRRMQQIKVPSMEEVDNFVDALDTFVNGRSCAAKPLLCSSGICSDCSPASTERHGWGLHDPTPLEACIGTAECNPCCWPPGRPALDSNGNPITKPLTDPETNKVVDVPVMIDEITPNFCREGDIPWEDYCTLNSPYGGLGDAFVKYPWVYDPYYENPNNKFLSFRELIGKDDEHRDFYKNSFTTQSPGLWNPNAIPQNPHVSGDEGFYLEDAQNFYIPPYYSPDVFEKHKGIHPFFHKIREWGVDLADVPFNIANPPGSPYKGSRECHWCDPRGPCPECGDPCPPCVGDTCPFCPTRGPLPQPREVTQLRLPLDPGNVLDGILFNKSYFVDGTPDTGAPPLRPDKITQPKGILAEDDACADDALYPPNTNDAGFWKPGLDRYCSKEWSYGQGCLDKDPQTCEGLVTADDDDSENDSCPCPPGEPRALLFPEDPLDSMYESLGQFISIANSLIARGRDNLPSFAASFEEWYQEIYEWIEADGSPCYICDLTDPPEGFLYVFRYELEQMRDRIKRWLDNDGKGFVGATCTDVWCMPEAGLSCPLIQPDESKTFTAGSTYGDLESIVACLDHNVNGLGATGARGNAARFKECYNLCLECSTDMAKCTSAVNDACGGNPGTYLPRSLIPGFDPNADFVPVDVGALGFCGLGGSTATSGGATYYIATTGSDSNPGTEAAPFKKLKQALSVMSGGDKVLFRGGTYTGKGYSFGKGDIPPSGTSWSNATIIASYPGETVTIEFSSEPASSGFNLCGFNFTAFQYGNPADAYIMIDGLIMDGANCGRDQNAIYMYGGSAVTATDGMEAESHHLRFQNLEIKNFGESAIAGGGDAIEAVNIIMYNNGFNITTSMWNGKIVTRGQHAVYFWGHDSLFEGLESYRNAGLGFQINQSKPGFTNDNNIIRNNLIYENGLAFTQGLANTSNGAGMAIDGNNNLIYNNVFLRGPSDQSNGISVGYDPESLNNKIYNNTFYVGRGWAIIVNDRSKNPAANNEIKNNLMYKVQGGIDDRALGTVISNNLYNINPNFVNPASEDFRLTAGSPAIDTGETIAVVNNDFDYGARPFGSAHDIGAFEFGAPPGTTPGGGAGCGAGAQGSCAPGAPLVPGMGKSFLYLVIQSAIEAENQVAKFDKRAKFIDGLRKNAEDIVKILSDAEEQFNIFLTGAATELIEARVDLDLQERGLPYHAIYGWKGADRPDGTPGKWHIVKVEARVQGRCDNRCAYNQGEPDPGWPKIKTYTKKWGLKRCFQLRNEEGSVKFRTTRYDEEVQSGLLKFPTTGMALWKYRSAHPERSQTGLDPKTNTTKLASYCRSEEATITQFIDTTLAGSPSIYEGAFMMNDREDNKGCWDLAHDFLTLGVVDETCARYKWSQDDDRMNFKFVDCLPF